MIPTKLLSAHALSPVPCDYSYTYILEFIIYRITSIARKQSVNLKQMISNE